VRNTIYCHYRNGILYEVLQDENLYIQEDDEWIEAIRYKMWGNNSPLEFVRSKKEFKLKFMIYSDKKTKEQK